MNVQGFDRIYTLPSGLPLSPTQAQLQELIASIDAAPKATARPSTNNRGRGRGFRGGNMRAANRGRGSSRGGSSFRPAPSSNPWSRSRPSTDGGNRLGGPASNSSNIGSESSEVVDAAALRERREAALRAIEARRPLPSHHDEIL